MLLLAQAVADDGLLDEPDEETMEGIIDSLGLTSESVRATRARMLDNIRRYQKTGQIKKQDLEPRVLSKYRHGPPPDMSPEAVSFRKAEARAKKIKDRETRRRAESVRSHSLPDAIAAKRRGNPS